MELQQATAATGMVLGFFRRMLTGPPDPMADETARRVLEVLDNLGRSDPATRSALATLRARPDDPAARALLEQRIDTYARHNAHFQHDLNHSLAAPPASTNTSRPPTAAAAWQPPTGGSASPPPTGAGTRWLPTGAGTRWLPAAVGTRWQSMGAGNRRVLIGAGALLLVILLGCGGVGLTYLRGSTTFFDTRTDLSAPGGWSYRVTEAHLKTSPQLEDRSPAKPGFRYLYFDITVENRLDDREAPGIQFSFARPENSMSAGCGAQQTGFFGPVSSYASGVVPGWCVSKSNSFLTGGASCFETNDDFFRSVDRIPPGGENHLRCVDSYFVSDDFDLGSLRVYYLGDSYTQIPTST
ncbi:hypothetical protein ACQPZJ_38670 [Actinoplanes sp. CA-054009]